MKYKLPDSVYQILKWVGLIACPALATFYGVVAPLWGLPNVEAVVTTINALGVLIGALIGYSALTATATNTVVDTPATQNTSLSESDLNAYFSESSND